MDLLFVQPADSAVLEAGLAGDAANDGLGWEGGPLLAGLGDIEELK